MLHDSGDSAFLELERLVFEVVIAGIASDRLDLAVERRGRLDRPLAGDLAEALRDPS